MLEQLDFLPVAIGLFGIAEVLVSIESRQELAPMKTRLEEAQAKAAELARVHKAKLAEAARRTAP